MLYPFMKAYCNDDFTHFNLVATGTDEEKEWRWKVILEEYSWLMKNEDGDHLFDIAKKIYILRTHITAVDWCSYYLINFPFDKEIADKLSEVYPMDYSVKGNVQRALTMVDTKRYELEILTDEYTRLHGTSKGEKPTEKEFMKNIAQAAKFQGSPINIFQTTVAMYAAIYQNAMESTKNSS